MLRCLFSVCLSCFAIGNLISQVVVNEFIFENDSTLKIELYNFSEEFLVIKSIDVCSDTLEIKKNFPNFAIQPLKLSLIELKMSFHVPELHKVIITIETDNTQLYDNFNGYILMGESAGRCPDIYGDFIIYNNSQITPGSANYVPGILVKKTSKTKFTPRDSSPNASLYFNNYYWIFGGWDYNYESNTWSSKSNIWKSPDGLDWTLVNKSPPFSHYSGYFAFNNKIFIYRADSVFVTEDGLKWEKYLLRNDFYFAEARYAIFKNMAYAFRWNKIGVSTDGINWTITETNIDPRRTLPAFVASEDRFWMYGGLGGYNDVWTSLDGFYWTKLLDHAPWEKRHWFNYTYFDNKIWMIAGNSDNYANDPVNFGNLEDFWYSSDGINWNLLNKNISFQNRHGSFLWNDGHRVLMSSGFGNNLLSRMYNDVWELDAPITLSTVKGTTDQTICQYAPLSDISYKIRGATGADVSGLPDGVEGTFKSGVLTVSGKPAESGTYTYTVTATGPVVLPVSEGSIIVKPGVSPNLISVAGTNKQMLRINTPLREISYDVTNASGANASGLPEGVLGSFSSGLFTIAGIPKATGSFNYTISCSGECVESEAQGTILVNNTLIYPNPTSGIITILNVGHFSLKILDISGHQIFNETYNDDYTIFEKDFSNVFKTNGEYLIVLQESSTDKPVSQKIVFIR
jgi:hypothetical protein